MHYLNANDKLQNKPTYWQDSYFTVYEKSLQDENPPDTSVKLMPCPVNCETPPFIEELTSECRFSNGTDSYLKTNYLSPNKNICDI